MGFPSKTFGIAIVGAFLLTAQSFAQDINTDYDHNFKFNIVNHYAWGKVEASDPMVEPRIAAAVDHVLQQYGFKESGKTGATAETDSKPTTMIVTAVEARSPGQYVAFYRNLNNLDWHRGWEGGGFSNSAANLRQIHAGTLIVDLYDGTTGKLIWRGTAAVGPNEKLEQAEVDKEINTMFAHFPPKSGGPMAPNQTEVAPSPSSEPGINSPPN
jgi:hypothetical protein